MSEAEKWSYVRIEPLRTGHTDHNGLYTRDRIELVYKSEAEAKIEDLRAKIAMAIEALERCGVKII